MNLCIYCHTLRHCPSKIWEDWQKVRPKYRDWRCHVYHGQDVYLVLEVWRPYGGLFEMGVLVWLHSKIRASRPSQGSKPTRRTKQSGVAVASESYLSYKPAEQRTSQIRPTVYRSVLRKIVHYKPEHQRLWWMRLQLPLSLELSYLQKSWWIMSFQILHYHRPRLTGGR